MKKNLLFLIPTLTGGGAERVITTLLKHLDRSRFRLSLAVVNTRDAVFYDQIPEDVDLIDLGCKRVRYALLNIIALIWKQRPDVVFSTLGHLNLAMAMIRPLLPRDIFFIARETNIVSCSLQTYKCSKLVKHFYRWFYQRNDLVVCQSHYMQTDLIENFSFSKNRTVVINNPVDVEYIQKLVDGSEKYLKVNRDRICLVAAGRMAYEKGFDLLIEAIALLADFRVRLVLLGEGPLLDKLKVLAVTRGVADQTEFVGFQSNPYAWFAEADAFVLSSRFEGFPNVVLEALACGTPVISTPALGGTREILDGVKECIVAEDISAPALADALRSWLNGTRCPVPPVVLEPYSLDRIIGQYQQVLEGGDV